MSDALSIATNGLNNAASRIVKATASIVNASSTTGGGDLTTSLVNIAADKISYQTDAKVIRAVERNNKTLLDILA